MFDNYRIFHNFVVIIETGRNTTTKKTMRTNKQHMVIIAKSQFSNCWYPRMSSIGSTVVNDTDLG